MHTLLINLDKVKVVLGILAVLAGLGAGYIGGVRSSAAANQRTEDRLLSVEEDVESISDWVKHHAEWGNEAHRELLQRISSLEAKIDMIVERVK